VQDRENEYRRAIWQVCNLIAGSGPKADIIDLNAGKVAMPDLRVFAKQEKGVFQSVGGTESQRFTSLSEVGYSAFKIGSGVLREGE